MKTSLVSQFSQNVISGGITAAANSGLVIISFPLYLHFLGYGAYGVWLILATLFNLLQLSSFGIGEALMKYVAQNRGTVDGEKVVESYSSTAMAFLILVGTAAGVMAVVFRQGIVGAFALSATDAETAKRLVPYIAALSAYSVVLQLHGGLLSGAGRMDLSNYAQLAGRTVALVLSALLLAQGGGVSSLLAGQAAGLAVLHLVNHQFVRRVLPVRAFRIASIDPHRARELLKLGGGVFGGSVMAMLVHPLDRIVISRYLGVASIPVFDIAFSGSMQFRTLFEAGVRALAPEVSRLTAKCGDSFRARAKRLNRRVTMLLLVGGAPLYIALFLLAGAALRLWLGERFVPAAVPVFRIMLVASAASLAGVPSYFYLLGLGRGRVILAAHMIQSLINVGCIGVLLAFGGHPTLEFLGLSLGLGFACSSIFLLGVQKLASQELGLSFGTNAPPRSGRNGGPG